MKIKGLNFVQTCMACPEQYEVFIENSKQVGYIRLRWGILRVDYPDCLNETIYTHDFEEGFKGTFSDGERDEYLNMIADIINEKIKNES